MKYFISKNIFPDLFFRSFFRIITSSKQKLQVKRIISSIILIALEQSLEHLY